MAEGDGSKVIYFLAGLALGAFVGLVVVATKLGNETRAFESAKIDEGREYAQRKARELRERAEELIERAGPHGPGEPEPDDDEPHSRKLNLG
jgi:hypothetical protein